MIPTAGRVMEQISKENKNEEVNYISGADPGFFFRMECTRLLLYFNTNKSHSFFFFFFLAEYQLY